MNPKISLIAAVGRSGQLGLKGGLPWGDLFPEDRRAFRERTEGGILIVGHRTYPSVRRLQGTHDRAILVDNTGVSTDRFLDFYDIADRHVWIAGGAATYRRWLPKVGERVITVLDWDGEADTWMPRSVWMPPQMAAA